MKKLILIFLLFATLGASAQVYQNPNPGLYGIRYNRIASDSTFSFPTGNGAPTLKSNRINQAAIYQDSTGHVTYIYDGKAHSWSPIGTGSGFVTSVSGTSNRIIITGTTTPTVDIASTYVGQTSITTLGTIGTGTWQGSLVVGQYGGTGVANTGKTITLGGNFVTSGAFATTLTVTGTTNVTLPTSGTLLVKTTITKAGSDVNAAGYIDLSASTIPAFPTVAVYIDGVQATGVMFWNPSNTRLYGFTGSESAGAVIKIIFI